MIQMSPSVGPASGCAGSGHRPISGMLCFAPALFRRLSVAIAATFVAAMAAMSPARAASAGTNTVPSTDSFAGVLTKHLTNNLVRYAALKADSRGLDEFLDSAAAVSRKQFDAWPQSDQIAFLINVYNAATLKLVTDNYPVKSIKKIGGWFSTPWKQEVVRLFGKTITLDEVEHGMLRAGYTEPRIHFALVCAAKGCPPLRTEPFTGAKLDEQLTDQGRRFLAQAEKNRFENGILYLSPIFQWFSGDFTASKLTVAEFVGPFLSADQRKALGKTDPKIRFTEYDWSLNDASAK